MPSLDNNTQAFFELVRAGLWETDARLSQFNDINYSQVLSLAEEQSVVGLVAAGLEHVTDVKVPKELVLQFVGNALQLEQRNLTMNLFIKRLIDSLRKEDIYTLLVKGQGVAQCYEKPLWRACGDIDLFLSDENYQKAKEYLKPIADTLDTEYARSKHQGMTIDSWVVELHGSLRCGLSYRMDKVLDDIYDNTFLGGYVRSWYDNGTQVFLLSAENEAIYVFSHFLSHFYKGGLGVRQICDWCRLLFKYQAEIDSSSLAKMIKKMRLMSEWKVFAAFAVHYLGMPLEAMPIFDSKKKWKRKANKVKAFLIDSGNFGHNRDSSYFWKYPYIIRKLISLGRRFGDVVSHTAIFPLDSFRFLSNIVWHGVVSTIRCE